MLFPFPQNFPPSSDPALLLIRAPSTSMSSDAAAPATSSTTAVADDFAYPRGHFGHLNEHEAKALEDFKALLEERGYFKPGPPASHDDPTLLYVLPRRKASLR